MGSVVVTIAACASELLRNRNRASNPVRIRYFFISNLPSWVEPFFALDAWFIQYNQAPRVVHRQLLRQPPSNHPHAHPPAKLAQTASCPARPPASRCRLTLPTSLRGLQFGLASVPTRTRVPGLQEQTTSVSAVSPKSKSPYLVPILRARFQALGRIAQ